ncbi:hypothetical protein Loa_02001 [Legionella oakridgensis ATCC 33761 = DSM 21215]|uniref:Uncharacterized protein n=1 Tax=Legionella oakridgensis ATCC 33761 = DSM 21215 TaxID=1268635 RepID=W0BCF4_9GAMM|nr:hypothetical protein Loa_02001 [Legionella oakridgensis ATCC 33761 = DSM 21215]
MPKNQEQPESIHNFAWKLRSLSTEEFDATCLEIKKIHPL